jgi:peptidoglycan/xylan/chitin deacetylase (PgdA/CDA1 family)
MPKLALKIDVNTYRGTRFGVPRLVEALQRHQAQASFYFTLGKDRTGRAIKRIFRPGFLSKSSRLSIWDHYGIKTLLYGTLLPAPDIGRKCADTMRAVRDAGFEVGIHGYDRIRWQDHAVAGDMAWTKREMQRAVDRFIEIFGIASKSHAAAGWQLNRHALRLMQHFGFNYTSDTRGTHPYIPTWNAEIIACPQLPTTLPTLDELINRDGIKLDNVAQHLLQMTKNPPPTGHVFTLQAEFEGGKWLPVFEQLLEGWKAQGYDIVSLRVYFESLPASLPRHEIAMRAVEGSTGMQAVQVLAG